MYSKSELLELLWYRGGGYYNIVVRPQLHFYGSNSKPYQRNLIYPFTQIKKSTFKYVNYTLQPTSPPNHPSITPIHSIPNLTISTLIQLSITLISQP